MVLILYVCNYFSNFLKTFITKSIILNNIIMFRHWNIGRLNAYRSQHNRKCFESIQSEGSRLLFWRRIWTDDSQPWTRIPILNQKLPLRIGAWKNNEQLQMSAELSRNIFLRIASVLQRRESDLRNFLAELNGRRWAWSRPELFKQLKTWKAEMFATLPTSNGNDADNNEHLSEQANISAQTGFLFPTTKTRIYLQRRNKVKDFWIEPQSFN